MSVVKVTHACVCMHRPSMYMYMCVVVQAYAHVQYMFIFPSNAAQCFYNVYLEHKHVLYNMHMYMPVPLCLFELVMCGFSLSLS